MINDIINSLYHIGEPYSKLLIFNSRYTLNKTIQLAKKLAFITPITFEIIRNAKKFVIFPPVEVAKIVENVPLEKDRENIVVVLSRITSTKKLEYSLYILRVLHQFFSVKAKLYIMGALNDSAYYHYLKSMAKRLHIEDFVEFFINVSDEEKIRLLSKAKVLFHPTPGEHFGMAIVEGMTAGAIPVIHRESGIGSLRILDENYMFTNIENIVDVAKIIAGALNNWSYEYAFKMRYLAMQFDSAVFRRGILEAFSYVFSK
jgi:glycosyltransferase involved in cell wall biosynthesis